MEKQTRRRFSSEFKSKVVVEALRERNTLEEIARKYEIHPNQIHTWKKEFLSKASVVFEVEDAMDPNEREVEIQRLYAQIGQLKVENDFLKKKLL